ncbi:MULTISPECIES: NAD(P)/FAD-dependent oxidoreductase [Streptomyces]|uniref:Dehydrogenase n=1 Tax=Streptomyces dengpaensis TaxID=2049881 RepID=A0ABN5HUD0_9ACTN|nr:MULTISPECIES: FAD-dependent oxidoreductase [Streptomyces]AVH54750.1 dehydrogenase [Streptomyces dengpaensis]PIB03840.1 dehydrogenase [Streptomyces sp. HG99]
MNILVIGGGYAGVWSAAGAVRTARENGVSDSELQVTLVSGGDDLVVRPRLYEADPEKMRIPLDRILGPIGVRRIAATVTRVDTAAKSVTATGRDGRTDLIPYDRLVLATGSQLVRPEFPGAQRMFDVDTLPAAAALENHLQRLPEAEPQQGRFTAVVVGAGFTGLEVATEIGSRLTAVADARGCTDAVRVVLVERADVLGPELGPGPRPHVASALTSLGVEQRLGRTVESLTEHEVRLSDGEVIPAATVVWTAGMTASPLTAFIPGERDRLGRLHVDEFLRVVGTPDVYAAGDTAAAIAEDGHTVMQSCQHAQPLGKFAGHNVAADLLGLAQVPFAPEPYGTCLDLGPARAVVTQGWHREVQVTGQAAKEIKVTINTELLYPPVDDADALLKEADYSFAPNGQVL